MGTQVNLFSLYYSAYFNFVKMQSSGNDFILCYRNKIDLTPDRVRFLCNRRLGVGCDQILSIEGHEENKIQIRIYNQDGSTARNCVNGLCAVMSHFFNYHTAYEECVVTYLHADGDLSFKGKADYTSGKIHIEIPSVLVKYDNGEEYIDIGNLHKVVVKESGVASFPLDVDERADEKFNVNYIKVIGDKKIGVTTVERGAGKTLSCGSGSCASAVYAVHNGLIEGNVVEVVSEGTEAVMSIDSSDEQGISIRCNKIGENEYSVIYESNSLESFVGNLPLDRIRQLP
ncbi:diaminopimelate epimerase [Rickettsiales bacterium]|nr:diaminopimelate epimerase [Rickettsiales bacterium]